MIWGGFSGAKDQPFDLGLPEFDRRRLVEMLIAAGLLRAGEGFNRYVLTEEGRAVVNRHAP